MASLKVPHSQTNVSNVNQKRSFTSVVQSQYFPKKEQAIVIEATEGTQIKDCAYALGKITEPTHIRFISRISNGRICAFLATKEIADNITDKHKHIRVNDTNLPLRPLINKAQRIILSNVYPTIPHALIEEIFDGLGVRKESTVSFLRAGLTEEGFSHILSFRRQIFIHPEDIRKIPESIKIEHDQTTYWIYPSTDTLRCFICKQEGHLAKNCKNNEPHFTPLNVPITTPPVNSNTEIHPKETDLNSSTISNLSSLINSKTNDKTDTPETSTQINPEEKTISVYPTTAAKQTKSNLSPYNNNTNEESGKPVNSLPNYPKGKMNSNDKITAVKRTSSEITDDSTRLTDTTENPDTVETSFKQPKKRANIPVIEKKKKYLDNLENVLQPIKTTLNEPGKLLNYYQFKSFLEKSYESPKTKEIAKEYSEDLESLKNFMLNDIYPKIADKGFKNRLTRTIRKLSKSDERTSTGSPTPSECSDTPQCSEDVGAN